MSWATLDDGFADHPKVLPISSDAFRLHVCAMCWCNRRGTDGAVVARDLRILSGMIPGEPNITDLVAELVAERLWDVTDTGWQLHDFLKWNKPAAKVKADREAHAQRQKEARDKAKESARAKACDVARDIARAPSPSHPIPSHIDLSHTPAQVNPGNQRPMPGPDDDAVKAWKAIEAGAGGPRGLGVDRKPAGTQELWLDDNRAMQWARNWYTLRQAEPPYTLADCEKLGRWIAAGGTGDFKTPWQMLSKAGKAPDISAWFSLALRWDPLTDPRANRLPSRVTVAVAVSRLPEPTPSAAELKRQEILHARSEGREIPWPEVDHAAIKRGLGIES